MLAESKQEIQDFVKDEINSYVKKDTDSLRIYQQQWKKFKESPEARLAAIETKMDGFIYETRDNFEKVDKQFDKVDKQFNRVDKRLEKFEDKFDAMNHQFNRIYELINAQVWKFFVGISFVAITLKFIDKLWP